MLLPLKIESSYVKMPIANITIICITSIFYFFTITDGLSKEDLNSLVLKQWDLQQMLGSLFLHADFFHLFGNMLVLWIFGNAINGIVGNLYYPVLYLVLGLFAGAVHLLFSGVPAIGASGAINGIVGMSLIIIPVNSLKVFYMYFPFYFRTFIIKAYWMILFWLTFDIIGLAIGGGNTAYWAHLGGFIAGNIIAIIIVSFELVETYDDTFLDIIFNRRQKTVQHDIFDVQDKELKAISNKIILDNNAENIKREMEIEKIIQNRERIPNFRLLKAIKRMDCLVCYFVNDGDEIRNIRIEPCDHNFRTEIVPDQLLKAKDSGCLKVYFMGTTIPDELNFKLVYANGTEDLGIKKITYSNKENKLIMS